MDRQKKPLHHKMTDRGGHAGLPLEAAKITEGYFSSRGHPLELWGLNPKLGSPVYSIRARKEPRKHPAVKRRVSICQGGMAGDTESLLKGQCTKFHLQPLTLDSANGREDWARDA